MISSFLLPFTGSLLVLIAACTIILSAAGCGCSAQCALNNSGCTSAPVSDIEQNRSLWTVYFACSAFHAKIAADDTNFLIDRLKNLMRADLYTHAAVIAFLLDQLEGDDLGIIS
jgi:hypothetical protein